MTPVRFKMNNGMSLRFTYSLYCPQPLFHFTFSPLLKAVKEGTLHECVVVAEASQHREESRVCTFMAWERQLKADRQVAGELWTESNPMDGSFAVLAWEIAFSPHKFSKVTYCSVKRKKIIPWRQILAHAKSWVCLTKMWESINYHILLGTI